MNFHVSDENRKHDLLAKHLLLVFEIDTRYEYKLAANYHIGVFVVFAIRNLCININGQLLFRYNRIRSNSVVFSLMIQFRISAGKTIAG